ncbi:MAG: 2-dehydropantoate 2-reductase [Verrucomicrobiales bacterium]|nr:2-dehydropantoate 2-reductase [Verrucomicrobiales bacterium]
MNITILGAGAMGSAIGALLQNSGQKVTLIDVWKEAVDKINRDGLRVDDKAGNSTVTKIRALTNAIAADSTDLLIVFVKCYHTEAAVKAAQPIIGPGTTVLSLQNGWGNGPRIARMVGPDKVVLGVCYHSATVLGPGHVFHAGQGKTFVGELDGKMTGRLANLADTFNKAGIEVTPTSEVLREIWSKLALNVATLPTSASLKLTADHLCDTDAMQSLMRELLNEAVLVANAQKIPLDFDERWQAITGLLKKLAPNSKPSMLQDVEKQRLTEIDVINGAIVEAGHRVGIPTPYNQALVWLIKALERSFEKS